MKKNLLDNVDKVIEGGPFSASWDSLEAYRVPEWYEDAKFGIFIHWGVYSVPAFGHEWYPRKMYDRSTPEYEHHVETYGAQDRFGYKDFIPMFQAEEFDPDGWADLFRRAGARFVVPVAEHHDGFQMYDSALSRWNAVQMGPKRDIIGELSQSVRDAGMVFGVSSHRAEHWWYFDEGMKFDSDIREEEYRDLYGPAQPAAINWHDLTSGQPDREFLEDWLARTCELVDKYQPQLVWFDWWIENLAFKRYLKKFCAYYYNEAARWDAGVAINHKYEAFPVGTAVFDVERGQLSGTRGLYWQTDTSVSKNSWGYIEGHRYKEASDIIGDLVDVVSKNGALLLNIGPRPDGTIPEEEEKILLEIGEWLEVNGEAIYGTRPWLIYGEGPTRVQAGAFTDTRRSSYTSEDIRFTSKGNVLYASVLQWPEDGRIHIKFEHPKNSETLQPEIEDIELLGSPSPVRWSANDHGLSVEAGAGSDGGIRVLKITTK